MEMNTEPTPEEVADRYQRGALVLKALKSGGWTEIDVLYCASFVLATFIVDAMSAGHMTRDEFEAGKSPMGERLLKLSADVQMIATVQEDSDGDA